METKANYVLIGAFTLAVIAGGFLFVLWFTGASKTAVHKTFKIVFTGSVSGLTRGSGVTTSGTAASSEDNRISGNGSGNVHGTALTSAAQQ